MRRVHLLLAAVLIAAGLFAPRTTHAQGRLCFNAPGITNCIEGRIREYWEQNGGLPVFGYPITPARPEVNRDTGQTYTTQWFERNRFELHPENQRPYDVLLGRLGVDRLQQQGRNWQQFPREGQFAGCLYFEATAHNVCATNGFRAYWESHGLEFDGQPGKSFAESLALFGAPVSSTQEERNAAGATVYTQWFERARFEYHPNNPPEFRVLLGLLGNEVTAGGTPPPPPPPTDPCANIRPPQDATLSKNCVRYGETFLIEVQGFVPNQQIGFWITDQFGNNVGTNRTLSVDADGGLLLEIDTTDYFGYELRRGDYLFVARDPSGLLRDSLAPFRVLE